MNSSCTFTSTSPFASETARNLKSTVSPPLDATTAIVPGYSPSGRSAAGVSASVTAIDPPGAIDCAVAEVTTRIHGTSGVTMRTFSAAPPPLLVTSNDTSVVWPRTMPRVR